MDRAISWVLLDAGTPVPIAKNWRIPGQVTDGASEEGTVGADGGDQAGERLKGLIADGPVSSEVVLPPQILTIYWAGNHTCGPKADDDRLRASPISY
jgi:hypothetical protein